MRMQESLVKTVPGTKHHTMLPETNGSFVPISCEMPNDQNSHANLPEAPEGTSVQARTLTAGSPPVETAFPRLA
jgi:hypothetical protein